MTPGEPAPLEIQIHMKDGKSLEFLQRDPLIAQRILDQLQPAKIFGQRMIMLGEPKSLTAFPSSTIVRIDLIGESVPSWPFPNDAKDVKMISEGEFLSRYDTENYTARTHAGAGNTRAIGSPNTARFVPGQSDLPRTRAISEYDSHQRPAGGLADSAPSQFQPYATTGQPATSRTPPMNGYSAMPAQPRNGSLNGGSYGLSGGQTTDQPRTVFSEIELVNGARIFLEVSQGQPQRATKPTALDYALYVQNFFTLSSVHARRRESGMVILNPAHFLRCTFYPGVTEMPPGCWNAERLD